MPHYRLYFLSSRTGSIERHEQFEARDDDDALDTIDPYLLGDHPIELWTGGRKVGQFDTALAISGLASHWSRGEPSPPQSRSVFRF